MTSDYWWSSDPSERYWLETTERHDIGGELWAPKPGAPFQKLVSQVQVGDVVLHYSTNQQAIVGYSVAVGPLQEEVREWRGVRGPQWVMPVGEFRLLRPPVALQEINDHLFAAVVEVIEQVKQTAGKRSAYLGWDIRRSGGVPTEIRPHEGGYLSKFPLALARLVVPDIVADESPAKYANPTGAAQGYVSDAERRATTERYAVECAEKYYMKQGAIEVTRLGKPYDLLVRFPSGTVRHVEVKGSSVRDIDAVQLTSNEVDHARNWVPTDLGRVDQEVQAQDRRVSMV